MFDEHSPVVLTRALPSRRLELGALGVVVHVHGLGIAYEVEFLNGDGRTIAVETVPAEDLRAAPESAGA
ncbi:MAG: DUF4926 domain-containing protein [Paludibacterium sp.]|uniref:DUF4926 domain-containing protein n=1 Tax=Paludibacterium sp. TaxID=1917523 RepID=UPI0025DE8FC7|nr:DUF4926 domain-containing protein [Paludibacterium sp.]MBV8046006.1 DUF4926 domain-containing protein [Paludibacterium sp.]MBV8465590.1 DUF4926 domain-containing protein [Burkholderiales bacterium]